MSTEGRITSKLNICPFPKIQQLFYPCRTKIEGNKMPRFNNHSVVSKLKDETTDRNKEETELSGCC